MIDNKAVWTALQEGDEIVYTLECGGRAGEICCVPYGEDYWKDTIPDYIDHEADPLEYILIH